MQVKGLSEMDLLTSAETSRIISSIIAANGANYEKSPPSVVGRVIFETDANAEGINATHKSLAPDGKKWFTKYLLEILEFVNLSRVLSLLQRLKLARIVLAQIYVPKHCCSDWKIIYFASGRISNVYRISRTKATDFSS